MGTLWSIRPLGGMLLRYEICLVLWRADCLLTVPEIVRAIEADGFELGGRASKTVSDALRWEVRRDRLRRYRRGWYGAGHIPPTTLHRMRTRMEQVRSELSLERGQELERQLAALSTESELSLERGTELPPAIARRLAERER